MKHLILIAALTLVACAKEKDAPIFNLSFNGEAKTFQQGDALKLGGSRVVDSSIINRGDHMEVYYDYADWKALDTVKIDSKGESAPRALPAGINFTYTLYRNNTYFMFGQKLGDIYLFTSIDGLVWTAMNGSSPVLTHSVDPSSNWNQLWNVGVDIDDAGLWHMFVECSDSAPGQAHVGLCYTNSMDPNDFDSGKTPTFMPGGGNPYVKALSGRGLLIVHGQIFKAQDQFTAPYWHVTASTMVAGIISNHDGKFSLGIPGVHICDPHMAIALDGSLMLVVSVDQSHVQAAYAPGSFESLFDSLTH